jgi:hypothetical protein
MPGGARRAQVANGDFGGILCPRSGEIGERAAFVTGAFVARKTPFVARTCNSSQQLLFSEKS